MVVAVGRVTLGDLDQGFASLLADSEEAVDALLSEVADVIRDDAKATASFIDRTGNLRKSIGKRKSKFIRGGYIVKASGRNRGTDSAGGKGFHAFLVEYGHVMVAWGRKTGRRVPPHPFMRPARAKGMRFAAAKIASMGKK